MVLLAPKLAARSRAGSAQPALLDECRSAAWRPRSSPKGRQKGQAIPGNGEQLSQIAPNCFPPECSNAPGRFRLIPGLARSSFSPAAISIIDLASWLGSPRAFGVSHRRTSPSLRLRRPFSAVHTNGKPRWGCLPGGVFSGYQKTVAPAHGNTEAIPQAQRLIANLYAAHSPTVTVPESLANQPANGLFDVDRLRRVINLRRRSRTCQGAAQQRPANQSADYASGDLTILRFCRRRQQKRTCGQCSSHDS